MTRKILLAVLVVVACVLGALRLAERTEFDKGARSLGVDPSTLRKAQEGDETAENEVRKQIARDIFKQAGWPTDGS